MDYRKLTDFHSFATPAGLFFRSLLSFLYMHYHLSSRSSAHTTRSDGRLFPVLLRGQYSD